MEKLKNVKTRITSLGKAKNELQDIITFMNTHPTLVNLMTMYKPNVTLSKVKITDKNAQVLLEFVFPKPYHVIEDLPEEQS